MLKSRSGAEQDNFIRSALSTLGLNEKEIKVYLVILELGPQAASIIARRAGLKRSDIYNQISLLERKGLITRFSKYGVNFFSPSPLSKLTSILEKHRRSLKNAQYYLKQVLPSLLLLNQGKLKNPPRVHFYEGPKGIIELYSRSLESKGGNLISISSLSNLDNDTTKIYDQQYYVPTRKKRGIFLRHLVFNTLHNRKLWSGDKTNFRETRFLPKNFPLTDTLITAYDDEMILVSLKLPYFGVLIESPEITQMFKAMFEIIWENSK